MLKLLYSSCSNVILLSCGKRSKVMSINRTGCSSTAVAGRHTDLDVKHSDEVGPLGVVFDQTGHAAAFLVPAAVPVCCEHLDHCRGQRLRRHGGPFYRSHVWRYLKKKNSFNRDGFNSGHFKDVGIIKVDTKHAE